MLITILDGNHVVVISETIWYRFMSQWIKTAKKC